jgi:hypothetical protein
MRSFISRKRERLHHAKVKHIRESSLDRIEVLFVAAAIETVKTAPPT